MTRTGNNCLGLRLRYDLLIALLSPHLIIVLHTPWLVRFRLLQSQSNGAVNIKSATAKAMRTYPHLRFRKIFATPIKKRALQG